MLAAARVTGVVGQIGVVTGAWRAFKTRRRRKMKLRSSPRAAVSTFTAGRPISSGFLSGLRRTWTILIESGSYGEPTELGAAGRASKEQLGNLANPVTSLESRADAAPLVISNSYLSKTAVIKPAKGAQQKRQEEPAVVIAGRLAKEPRVLANIFRLRSWFLNNNKFINPTGGKNKL